MNFESYLPAVFQLAKGQVCYLIHCDQVVHPRNNSQHYLGTSVKLVRRIKKHLEHPDAKFMQRVKELGIHWTVVRIWEGGYDLEKQLKNRKNARMLCPICKAEALARHRESSHRCRNSASQSLVI